jgi:hypothetical protein
MLQKKYSVCHVEAAELYEKGKAKTGGLSDPRMGTMDKFGTICATDGANMHDCPGYFGHIELSEPVYHCRWHGHEAQQQRQQQQQQQLAAAGCRSRSSKQCTEALYRGVQHQ